MKTIQEYIDLLSKSIELPQTVLGHAYNNIPIIALTDPMEEGGEVSNSVYNWAYNRLQESINQCAIIIQSLTSTRSQLASILSDFKQGTPSNKVLTYNYYTSYRGVDTTYYVDFNDSVIVNTLTGKTYTAKEVSEGLKIQQFFYKDKEECNFFILLASVEELTSSCIYINESLNSIVNNSSMTKKVVDYLTQNKGMG